jgi:hypothetical protein
VIVIMLSGRITRAESLVITVLMVIVGVLERRGNSRWCGPLGALEGGVDDVWRRGTGGRVSELCNRTTRRRQRAAVIEEYSEAFGRVGYVADRVVKCPKGDGCLPVSRTLIAGVGVLVTLLLCSPALAETHRSVARFGSFSKPKGIALDGSLGDV